MADQISAAQAWLADPANAKDPRRGAVQQKLNTLIGASSHPARGQPSISSPMAATAGASPQLRAQQAQGLAQQVDDAEHAKLDEDEDEKHGTGAVVAHHAARLLPTAGAMVGGGAAGLLGVPAGPAAVATGAAGAGLGAGVGRAAQIKVDQGLGYPAPNLMDRDTITALLKEAALVGGTQGVLGGSGLIAGRAAPGMAEGKLRDATVGWARMQGAVSPAKALQLKGTQLEGVSPEVLDKVIGLSQGGKAAVPAASATADLIKARLPAGLEAENVAPNLAPAVTRLQGSVPQQALANEDLKAAVRQAIAKSVAQGPGGLAIAQRMVTPDALQAGFENTAGNAATAGDANALGSSGVVKDLASRLGAGWNAVGDARSVIEKAGMQGAQGTEDAVQAKALEGFVNKNTRRGLSRDSGNALNSTAALMGNRVRHAIAEASPWAAGSAVPKAIDAGRALEAEAMSRGLPAVNAGTREVLSQPNNPAVTRAAMELILRSYLYGSPTGAPSDALPQVSQ